MNHNHLNDGEQDLPPPRKRKGVFRRLVGFEGLQSGAEALGVGAEEPRVLGSLVQAREVVGDSFNRLFEETLLHAGQLLDAVQRDEVPDYLELDFETRIFAITKEGRAQIEAWRIQRAEALSAILEVTRTVESNLEIIDGQRRWNFVRVIGRLERSLQDALNSERNY